MPEPIFDTSAPVLVTGATGYVAGWLVKRLLEEGFTVHAPVRDPGKTIKVSHLTALAEELPGTLKLFKADLLVPGSYSEAMDGCAVVFHTASPFTSRITDPQRDLVDPALIGTKNVLASVNDAPSVKRVVLTSSCAAIFGDARDVAKAPNATLTEAQWNTTSSLDHQAYSYSKTVAERAAWEMAEAQNRWVLAVINPSFVIGPALSTDLTSESFKLIAQFGDGSMKPGVPHFEIGAVDVRDVAEAHLRAGFVPGTKGRHITSARTISFFEIGQALRAKFGTAYPFPKRALPTWLIWLIGPMIDKSLSRRMISGNMGQKWRADNSKSRVALGMTYRPLDIAAQEMFQQMVDSGKLAG